MNQQQLERMHSDLGFIAALDQSGGSTPKALLAYGLDQTAYANDEEMFDCVHQMRTRIIKTPSFNKDGILAAILFENTMDRTIDGKYTADYLWQEKGIVPILKIDKGLAEEKNHVKLMKPIPNLAETLKHAVEDRHIIAQQFDIALQVWHAGAVAIIEPEVDIHNPHKAESEAFMLEVIKEHLAKLGSDVKVMFKLTIPTVNNLYADLMKDPHVVRVVALSGGYSQDEACHLLSLNHGMIASFSRAFAQDLRYQQTDEEFDATVKAAIAKIYAASIA